MFWAVRLLGGLEVGLVAVMVAKDVFELTILASLQITGILATNRTTEARLFLLLGCVPLCLPW